MPVLRSRPSHSKSTRLDNVASQLERTRQRSTRRSTKPALYEPLDYAKGEIRLLILEPGKIGSRISARLFHASLGTGSDCPAFEALSYVWGPPEPSYNISLNGCRDNFSIGRNLRRALDDLRHPTCPRTLWVDALCINQADTQERGHQVQLMRKIYSSAQRVCSWLDHNVDLSLSVFSDLKRLGAGFELQDSSGPEYWFPITDIFRNPYWKRLWIQQELILASEIIVYCRRSVLNGHQLLLFQEKTWHANILGGSGRWALLNAFMNDQFGKCHGPEEVTARVHAMLSKAYLNLLTMPPDISVAAAVELLATYRSLSQQLLYKPIPFGGILSARQRLRIAKRCFGSSSSSVTPDKQLLGFSPSLESEGCLLSIFMDTWDLKMSDPKDHVYGILGIATDVTEFDLDIDYSCSTKEVYLGLCAFHLMKYRSLSFLIHGMSRNSESTSIRRRFGLPSWFPVYELNWYIAELHRASGSLLAQLNARVDLMSGMLSAHGFEVATISYIAPREPLAFYTLTKMKARLEAYCQEIARHNTRHGSLKARLLDDLYVLMLPRLPQALYKSFYQGAEPSDNERRCFIPDLCASLQTSRDAKGPSLAQTFCSSKKDSVIPLLIRGRCEQLFVGLDRNLTIGTLDRRVGVVSATDNVQVGDKIWVLQGCPMPVVLRDVQEDGGNDKVHQRRFTLAGTVNLPGIMNGEVFEGYSMREDGTLDCGGKPEPEQIGIV